jgi:hypothetical protein
MRRAVLPVGRLALAAALAIVLAGISALADPPAEKEATKPKPKFATRSLRGRVLFLGDALDKRFGIKTVPEAAERTLALQSAEGELVPLVEDVRGRAFRADERLRGVDVARLVRRYDGSPLVQVIDVCTIKNGRKYEVDYWCDVCSISMVELKACECCQGETVLRERPVQDKK